MFCQNCGKELDHDARYCKHCGFATSLGERPGFGGPASNGYTASVMMNKKSDALAIILSIIFPGLGHLYLGKISAGVGFLAVQAIMYVVAVMSFALAANLNSPPYWMFIVIVVIGLVAFMVLVYAVIDSYKVCQEYNALLAETGQPPW